MTVERTYKCDLCRATHSYKDLIGLHWTYLGWELSRSTSCETHLCETCLTSVGQIAQAYKQASTPLKKD